MSNKDLLPGSHHTFQQIKLDEEEQNITIRGLRRSLPGTVLYYLLVLLSAGILYIIDVWLNFLYIRIAFRKVPLAGAQFIQVWQYGKHTSLEKTTSISVNSSLIIRGFLTETKDETDTEPDSIQSNILVFTFRHYRFVYHPQTQLFVPVSKWKDPKWSHGRATESSGLSLEEHRERLQLFGECIIDIHEKSYIRLLWEEAINPFYVFQVASIVIWCTEAYYYYSAAIFVISVISIATTLVSTKRTTRKISQMSRYTCPVHVLRSDNWVSVDSKTLVPGDIFRLDNAQFTVLPCEAVLLEGDCIVNESMLTGESIPESKSPITQNQSSILQGVDLAAHTFSSDQSRHILFAGTHLIRVRSARSIYGSSGCKDYSTAMVLRTGFSTTKGTLVRSILFPRPTAFKFYRDAFRFIGVLACIAILGFIVNTINLHRLGVSASRIALRALDLITVVIPPALPACMSIGIAFAASRLRKKGIFTISPSRINVASKVAAVCFDKTGTLTEDGLDLLGICPAVDQSDSFGFSELCPNLEHVPFSGKEGLSIIHALATCHSLRLVDGIPVGDPLETKMLEFSGWHIEEPDDSSNRGSTANNGTFHEFKRLTTAYPPQQLQDSGHDTGFAYRPVSVLRIFEFSSNLRRASVITQTLQQPNVFTVYVKGAPEGIKTICTQDSIPPDYDQLLDRYTQDGYRVIALAGKSLVDCCSYSQLESMDRSSVENGLLFMGFLIFENRIKPETPSSLDELREANIRMIMCTGDNALTAVSVARNCHLIASNTRVFVPTLLLTDSCQSDRNTSSEKPQENLFSINSSGSLARIRWNESAGNSVGLDPLTLEPFAIDQNDALATQMARELANNGRYCIAVTGDVFTYIRDNTSDSTVALSECWKQLLMRGAVYARMSPELKAELVCNLQNIGYITCFCGDGANDCAALKTADVGISLSEAEASVAAPFTSHSKNVSCVSELLKEGRCSIATSFGCFKYMALYSMIQFTSCCLLYVYNSNLSDGQYLFIDLFTILPVAICMDRSKPYRMLVPKRPSASLTSKKVLTSLIGNVVLVIAFQVALFFIAESQPWYQKPVPTNPADPDSVPNKCDLNSSIFLLSIFQYLFTGAIFNIGPPYRQSALCNYAYMAVIVLLLAFDLWVLLVPVNGFLTLFGLVHVRVGWRFVILGLAAANFALCYLGEQFLFPLLAVPLAKMFRMVRWGFTGLVARLRGYEAPPLCEQHDYSADRSEIEGAASNKGIWARLGHRSNRKEYKLLLEKMVGGSSWY